MASDLARRLAVAAIGIPITVVATLAGGWVFALGLGVLSGVAAWEIGRMLEFRGDRYLFVPAILLAASLPPATLLTGGRGLWVVVTFGLLLAAGVSTFRIPPGERPFQAMALSVTAGLYAGGLLSFGVPLRESFGGGAAHGTLLFFLPVALTWLSDTAAYFGGRRFGRRKLAPVVSPNKTVEGGVLGLLAGPAGALVYGYLVLPSLPDALGPVVLVGLGFLIAAAAILGDLAESALKRECGVKDSSGLLPGHGGFLDRMDSLLWSIPVAYLFLRFIA